MGGQPRCSSEFYFEAEDETRPALSASNDRILYGPRPMVAEDSMVILPSLMPMPAIWRFRDA